MPRDYQNIMIFCGRPIKMAHCKNKIKIELWDALTTMNLQEGMVIKRI
jgi:hypothetical protein